MDELVIQKNCSINHLSKYANYAGKIVFEFKPESSFSLGAEGFFISIFNYKFSKGEVDKIKIHLSHQDLAKYGIPDNSSLISVAFLNICMKDVPIYDRFGNEVTGTVIDIMNRSVNMNEGVYEKGKFYSLYAFDPYFMHPPKLYIGNQDPSEEDFKILLKDKIEKKFIGDSFKIQSSFKEIYESINLYSFLKEIWENTTHHARRSEPSLRYIQISKLIFQNTEAIEKMDYPEATKSYLKSRSAKAKIFLVFEITDSGLGIYNTLKKEDEKISPHELILSAFSHGVTSKKERAAIRRGLGLLTALKCSEKLQALFILTTSGFIFTNYDKELDVLGNEIKYSSKIYDASCLSTSVSLVVPV